MGPITLISSNKKQHILYGFVIMCSKIKYVKIKMSTSGWPIVSRAFVLINGAPLIMLSCRNSESLSACALLLSYTLWIIGRKGFLGFFQRVSTLLAHVYMQVLTFRPTWIIKIFSFLLYEVIRSPWNEILDPSLYIASPFNNISYNLSVFLILNCFH